MSKESSPLPSNLVEPKISERKKREEKKAELTSIESERREKESKISEEKPKDEPVKKEALSRKQRVLTYFLDFLPAIGDEGEMDGNKFNEVLRTGAFNIVQLIIPVSICMAVVVTFQLAIAVHIPVTSRPVIYGMLTESAVNSGSGILVGLINAAVFITLIMLSTVALILLFKYRCNKVIFIWLLISSGLLVFIATSTYFVEILRVRNLVMDWATFVFCVWNYGSLGLMVIHWKGPLRVQQGYLILNSAVVAIILIKFLPDWSTWVILALLSVYDIIAVLCPKGPLRILVELAKERGELHLPSLVYSSTMMWTVTMADVNKKTGGNKKTDSSNSGFSSSVKVVPQSGSMASKERKMSDINKKLEVGSSGQDTSGNRKRAKSVGLNDTTSSMEKKKSTHSGSEGSQDDVSRGFKIGLGDLVFYSVLVGKAASVSDGNWIIIVSCFVAILMGLCITSLILGIVHRALPALPISIFFGLTFYFSSQYIIAPYVEVLNVNQVFI